MLERWRRLPPNDLRHQLIHRPLPRPIPSTTWHPPTFFPHPWASAQAVLEEVLAHRCVPSVHRRLPLLAHRRTAPTPSSSNAAGLHLSGCSAGAPETLPEEGTEEGLQLRAALNQASWQAIHVQHGPFGAEVWTDGGVLNAEQPDYISATAGFLYLAPAQSPAATYGASAEFTALCGSMTSFASQIPDGTAVLVGVDSQSLLQALAKSPLLTEDDHEDLLWSAFLGLARRGCTLVLQFFYSHVDNLLARIAPCHPKF